MEHAIKGGDLMSRPAWVAAVLLLTLTLPAQAARYPDVPGKEPPAAPASPAVPGIQQQTALQVTRSLFPEIPADAKLDVQLAQSDWNGKSVWQVVWQPEGRHLFVQLDTRDGQVTSIENYQYEEWGPGLPQVSQEEAERRAADWLARLAPGARAYLVREKLPFYDAMPSMIYPFQYTWQVAGHPVRGAGAHLTINSRNGELQNWHLSRPEGKTILPPAILAEIEARAAFAKLPLHLRYEVARDPSREGPYLKVIAREKPEEVEGPKMMLAYQPPRSLYLTQGKTWVDEAGQAVPDVGLPAMKMVPPSEKPYTPPAMPLDRTKAEALAKQVVGIDRAPDQINFNWWGSRRSYQFSWVDPEAGPKGGEMASVSIDAVAGVVQTIYGVGGITTGTPRLTRAEAEKVAIRFIQENRPDLAGNLIYQVTASMSSMGGMMPSHEFQFSRQYKGIPIGSNEFYVSVDAVTGKVTSFYGGEMDGKPILPEPEGVLAPAPLMAKLVDLSTLRLVWMPVIGADGEAVYHLVWALGQEVPVAYIEAQTGTFRDWDGTDVLRYRLPPTDVTGHWAEREVQSLFEQRIITVEDGKFKPNQPMTIGEAEAWLNRLDGPLPMMELDRGMEKPGVAPGEPRPDANQPISRETFARMVVLALGYEKIAAMPNTISMPFRDQAEIEMASRNAAAVLNGLGVVRGTPEGDFLPKKSLTRAEAARILYQSLPHRRYGWK
jgi:hypothetical protein